MTDEYDQYADKAALAALTPVGSRWWHIGTRQLYIVHSVIEGPENRVALRALPEGLYSNANERRERLLDLAHWYPVVEMSGERPLFADGSAVSSASDERNAHTPLHGVALAGDALAMKLPRAQCHKLCGTLLHWQAGGWRLWLEVRAAQAEPAASPFAVGDLVYDQGGPNDSPGLWRLKERDSTRRGWSAQLIKRGFPSELMSTTWLSDRFMEDVRRYKPEANQVWQLHGPPDGYLIMRLTLPVVPGLDREWLATVIGKRGSRRFPQEVGATVFIQPGDPALSASGNLLPLLGSSYNLGDEAWRQPEIREAAEKPVPAPAPGQLWHWVNPLCKAKHCTVRLLMRRTQKPGSGWVVENVDDDDQRSVGTQTWVAERGLELPGWSRVEPAPGQVWMRELAGQHIAVRLTGRAPVEHGDGWQWCGRVLAASEDVELPSESVALIFNRMQFDQATWTPVFDPARIDRFLVAGQARRDREAVGLWGWVPQLPQFKLNEQKETEMQTDTGVVVDWSYAETLKRINEQGTDQWSGDVEDAIRNYATVLVERLTPLLGLTPPLAEDTYRLLWHTMFDLLSVLLERQLRRGAQQPLRADLNAALPLLAPAAFNNASTAEDVAAFDRVEQDVQYAVHRLAELQKQYETEEEEMRRRRSHRAPAEPGLMERAGEALGGLAHEGGEAAWNVAAIKAVDWGKGMVVGVLSKKLAPGDRALRGKIAKLLNTDGGTVIIAFGLSGLAHAFGAKLAPALGIDSERLDYLGRRLRVMGMTQGGVALVDGVLAELQAKAGPLIAMLRAMPTLPNELPVPRVRDGLRDDPDVKVAEVAATNGVATPARGEA